jgi:hypothetical protein
MARMPQTIAALRQASLAPWPPPGRATKRSLGEAVFQRFVAFRLQRNRNRPGLPRFELWHILRGLFAHAGSHVAPGILGVSDRRVRQLCCVDPRRDDQPTSIQLRKLERWTAKLPTMLQEWRVESIAAINTEAERRKLEIALA